MHTQLTLEPPADLIVSDMPTILVVEDTLAPRDLLCGVLSEEHPGFRVCGASAGQQALAIAAQARPCLLLLDDHLASSMNGIQLFDALHAREKSLIPTIMLSADAPPEEVESRRIFNLDKPFDLEMLLEHVGRELPSAQAVGVFPSAD